MARAEGAQLFIDYEAFGEGAGYVRPSVLLKFGTRSTGEPNEPRPVACGTALHLPDVTDVTGLDAAGFADSAAKDRALAHAVAEHKSIFFAESMPDGAPIDYRATVTGALNPHPAATRGRRWPRTTYTRLKTAFSWATPSPSTSCCSVARRLRSR